MQHRIPSRLLALPVFVAGAALFSAQLEAKPAVSSLSAAILASSATVECANTRCLLPAEQGTCPEQTGTYCAPGFTTGDDGKITFTCSTERCAKASDSTGN